MRRGGCVGERRRHGLTAHTSFLADEGGQCVALLGVKKAYRGFGIDLNLSLLMEIWKRRPKHGLHWELAWILEDNHLMMRTLQQIGAVTYKRYRLYQKTFARPVPLR